VTSAPPGWYSDPYGAASLRWWDGTTWTAYTQANGDRVAKLLRQLPWKPWLASAVAIVVAGVILFGRAESTRTPDPQVWYGIGFAAIGTMILVTAALTLARQRWPYLLMFVAVAASATAFAVFTVTAPSASRSCNNAGQPRSAGTYDCDTSFGIGGPILLGVLSIPTAAVATIGKVGADTYCAARRRLATRRRIR
jgi:hypothetical protein